MGSGRYRREDAPEVVIRYRRPPDRERRYRQELLLDGEELKVTLFRVPAAGGAMEVGAGTRLLPGAALLWYSFPGRPYEVAAFHDPEGEFLGHYTNVVRPPELEGEEWEITDLFLDVWQPDGGPPRILDREELEEARREGWVTEAEAREAERVAGEVRDRARAGEWPPPGVRRWPLDAVPTLRLRRDEPGTYRANRVALRVIAFGLYMLGAISLTTLAFALLGDGLTIEGAARRWWLGLMAAEAAVLLPACLAGRLPATRRVRVREAMNEHTLFLGAAVGGAAVLLVNESALWRSLLSAVYGALGLFLAIFAVCRIVYDRRLPRLALAGFAVCVAALFLLL